MSEPVTICAESQPRLARHVKLRFDKARDRWVMLAPERVLVPDEIAAEIVQRCDGKATVGDIVSELAAQFNAAEEEVGSDVVAMLQDLADKGFLEA